MTGLGFRVTTEYNNKSDKLTLLSDSPDFSEPLKFNVPRGSFQEQEIKALLNEQGVVDFASVEAGVHLPDEDHVGSFGVYSDGAEAPYAIETHKHLFVVGSSKSGVKNLARHYLLWALKNNIKVLAVNIDADLYGTASYFPYGQVVHYRDGFDASFEAVVEQEVSAVNDNYDGIFVLAYSDSVDISELFDNSEPHEDYSNFIEFPLLDEAVYGPIYSLVMTSTATDDFEEDDLYSYNKNFKNHTIAIMGNTGKYVVEALTGNVFAVADIPERNNQGVMWIKGLTGWEKVHTYLVPRTAWV